MWCFLMICIQLNYVMYKHCLEILKYLWTILSCPSITTLKKQCCAQRQLKYNSIGISRNCGSVSIGLGSTVIFYISWTITLITWMWLISLFKASQLLIQQPLTCLSAFCLKDTDTKGRFSSPVLDVTEKQLIIERNQTLQLNCRWVICHG